MVKTFTLSVIVENSSGVLHRITVLFTRRRINIESLTAAQTDEPSISRITVVANIEERQVPTIVRQIRRIIEVRQAYASENADLHHKEVAMFKMRAESSQQRKDLEALAQANNAVTAALDPDGLVEPNSIVIEKIGTEEEISALYRLLEPFDVQEFARSGRIAIRRHALPNDIGIPIDAGLDVEPHLLDAI